MENLELLAVGCCAAPLLLELGTDAREAYKNFRRTRRTEIVENPEHSPLYWLEVGVLTAKITLYFAVESAIRAIWQSSFPYKEPHSR